MRGFTVKSVFRGPPDGLTDDECAVLEAAKNYINAHKGINNDSWHGSGRKLRDAVEKLGNSMFDWNES